MKISSTARYAVAALTHMARIPPGQVVVGHNLGKELAIPSGFLLRLLVALARAGILRSVKGPNGGYWLARPANQITLLDVMEAVEGPVVASLDFLNGDAATEQLDGRLQELCEQVTETYRKQLAGVTVAALAGGEKKRKAKEGGG